MIESIQSDVHKIGCVIPCFKGSWETLSVIDKTLRFADYIVLIDDACPNRTGRTVENEFGSNKKVKVIFNLCNQGVGKSSRIGIKHLIENQCSIIVKIDSDGQIDPSLIPDLIKPLILGKAEAAKGNRFTSIDNILSMPKIRIIGNLGLSFLNKLSTGYWELFDPTNGFIAFKATALNRIRLDKVDKRFFFESDLLFQCALAQITFSQLPMSSIYGDEISSLRPMQEIGRFASKHLVNFLKRLVYQYFILDFNAGSLEILGSIMGSIVTTIFSVKIILSGIFYNEYATPGEASLFAVLSIITMQMFIAFLYYDATQQPLMRQLRSNK